MERNIQQLPTELYQRISRGNRNVYRQLIPLSSTMRQRVTSALCSEPISGRELDNYLAADPEHEVYLKLFNKSLGIRYTRDGIEILMPGRGNNHQLLDLLLREGGSIDLDERFTLYRRRESCRNLYPGYAWKRIARDFSREINLLISKVSNPISPTLFTEIYALFMDFAGLLDMDYFPDITEAVESGDRQEALRLIREEANRLIEEANNRID